MARSDLCRPVRAWLEAFPRGALDSASASRLANLHGLTSAREGSLPGRLHSLYADVLTAFAARHGPEAPCFLVRAPARVNLMGMHTDHRGGAINPIALLETVACVGPRQDDIVAIENVDARYPARQFSITGELPQARVVDWEAWTREQFAARAKAGTSGDWSDYVKAAVLYYQNRHKGPTGQAQVVVSGMNMLYGSLVPPAAGLSSSSAMVVSSLIAAMSLTGEWGSVEMEEIIDWCGDAEWYVGTRGGKGDHASILCGKPASILHLEFFPTRVSAYALPPGTSIVLANSCVAAKKSAGARDFFNQRIAGYVIGEHLLKKLDPKTFAKSPNLAACTPRRAGITDSALYRLLKQVPEDLTRPQALAALPQAKDALERIFASHAEPSGGYEVRQILLFGLAEMERSDRAPEVLARGDVAGFGTLMNLSHDGDRIIKFSIDASGQIASKQEVRHRYPDALLDRMASEETPLWQVPGGYDACIEETGMLVDLALSVPGVYGARLIGAGRGGCVGVLCKGEAAEEVLGRLRRGYYEPKQLPLDSAFVAAPCQGAGVVEM